MYIRHITLYKEYNTIQSYVRRIKLLLEYYQENFNSAYIIPNNFKLPKDKDEIVKKALTKSELDESLKSIKNNKYFLVALIAGTCGLRCSEILELPWNDVDFENSLLRVNKQWKIDKKTKKSDFGKLKTKNSNRFVPIPPKTLKLLKQYKKIT